MSKCTECGGDHPWWDHGPVKKFGEDSIEPYVDWQLDPYDDGVEITTRAQRRKIMAQHDLDYIEPKQQPAGRRLYFDMKG